MKWFDRMTVFRKLLLAFAVVIGFCVVIGGTSLKTLSSMHDITDAICMESVPTGELSSMRWTLHGRRLMSFVPPKKG